MVISPVINCSSGLAFQYNITYGGGSFMLVPIQERFKLPALLNTLCQHILYLCHLWCNCMAYWNAVWYLISIVLKCDANFLAVEEPHYKENLSFHISLPPCVGQKIWASHWVMMMYETDNLFCLWIYKSCSFWIGLVYIVVLLVSTFQCLHQEALYFLAAS